MRFARWHLLTALMVGPTACDTPPAVRDSTAALPQIGASIPGFSYPALRGGTFDRSYLRYGHTIIALVPANVRGDEPEIVEFDSLTHVYSVRSAIIFPREFQPHDTAYRNEPSWMSGSAKAFAGDSGRVLAVFAPGGVVGEDGKRGASLHLPSFLLVSDSGKVLARVAGRPFAALQPVLDSLRAVADSGRRVEGAATIQRMRARVERALLAVDGTDAGEMSEGVDLRGTCSGEETVAKGLVPALVRMTDITSLNPGVIATIEITSVADVAPREGDNICGNSRLRVTPRVSTARYHLQLNENPAEDGRIPVYTEGSMPPVEDRNSGTPVAFVTLTSLGGQGVVLPQGVTVETLRARIDSIRAAALPKP